MCGLLVDVEDEVIIKKMYEIISFNYNTEAELNDALCTVVIMFLENPTKINKVRNKLIFAP